MNSLDGILKSQPQLQKMVATALSKEPSKGLFTEAKNDATPCENPGCELEHPTDGGQAYRHALKRLWEDKTTKPDYTLIPKEALDAYALQAQHGVEKYGRDSWKQEIKDRGIERFEQSLLRHVVQYVNGDRAENHLGAILCNAGYIAWNEAQPKEALQQGKLVGGSDDL